ncbi:PREDICTED: uncharacterized protein LOC108567229 [Nicrophorus vespilloides]|uniref:Uncharacterized protein LOC108567229 n=1 Tax=Nicrophorus vespilloides TaxID=110193 RepID=A0ABM1N8A3_NICVS|nr:PREDICTED: uncharacterized protein LOC108567229 [Nicrophorus vespilloides]
MKPIIAITFLLLAACSARDYGMSKENVELFKKIQIECAKSFNISDDLLRRSNTVNVPEFKEIGCFPHCAAQKLGIFEGNDYNPDKIRNIILPEKRVMFENVIKKCIVVRGDTACERAYDGYKCYANFAYKN